MAKVYAGGISLGTGLKIVNPSPVDDRLVVETTDDLLNVAALPNIYPGIIVSVTGDDKVYKWNGTDRTALVNWEQLAKITDVITDTSGLAVLASPNTFTQNNIFNSKVGIGEASPSSKLHILNVDKTLTLEKAPSGFFNSFGFDGDNAYMTYYTPAGNNGMTLGYGESTGGAPTISTLFLGTGGNVGIGTTSPSEKLHVNGGHLEVQNSGNTNIYLNAAEGSDGTLFFQENGSAKAKIQSDASNDSLLFTDGSSTDTMTLKGGKVGIRTTSPSVELEVNGDIKSSGDIEANTFSFTATSFEDVITTNTEVNGNTTFGNDLTHTHEYTGSVSFTGSLTVSDHILPNTNSNGTTGSTIGSETQKFKEIYAVNTFFGGVHEINLKTEGLDKMQEGTVLTLRNGMMCPCENEADPLVMGVVSKGENFPIVLGAEPILITGKIKEGDFIITSNIKGHGKGVNPHYIYDQQLFGKIIAQAIEDGKGESYTIKAMIRKM